MTGLLAKLLTTQLIPFLPPWFVPVATFLLLVYKGLYKENRDILDMLTGIPAIVIITATVAMMYVDSSMLNIFGSFSAVASMALQVLGGAIFGGFLAVVTNIGSDILMNITKK